MRRGADPDAAEADLEAAHEVEALEEDRSPVETPVAIGVLEDQDAVLAFALGRPFGIAVSLRDPEPAAIVDRHGDRLVNVRLAREEFHREAVPAGHREGGLFRRQAGKPQDIERGIGGAGGGGEGEEQRRSEEPGGIHARQCSAGARAGISKARAAKPGPPASPLRD